MRETAIRWILLAAVLASSPALFAAEDMITIPTRPGVTQSFVLTTPDNGQPDVVLILFPGGHGQINLRRVDGELRFGAANFLVRERERFVALGAATATVDAPSDNSISGIDNGFRAGKKHATDISFVIDDLRKRWPAARIFLVGTSNGTVSAAAVAHRLKDRIDGVVLTSTVRDASTGDMKKLGKPVLLVHHRLDGCLFSPYGGVKGLSPSLPLITVNGGSPAMSNPCEPYSAHGYYGVEAPVVAAIMHWIRGEPYPAEVNADTQ
jgi:hypothetical protein